MGFGMEEGCWRCARGDFGMNVVRCRAGSEGGGEFDDEVALK